MATRFFWRWRDYAEQPDPSMTRERAARLLRAWRRQSRLPSNSDGVEFARIGLHHYRVAVPGEPHEVHFMRIESD